MTTSTNIRRSQRRVQRAEHRLVRDAQTWRARLARHRGALLFGGGVVAGLTLGLLPKSAYARARDAAASAIKSMLTSLVVSNLLARTWRPQRGRDQDLDVAAKQPDLPRHAARANEVEGAATRH